MPLKIYFCIVDSEKYLQLFTPNEKSSNYFTLSLDEIHKLHWLFLFGILSFTISAGKINF